MDVLIERVTEAILGGANVSETLTEAAKLPYRLNPGKYGFVYTPEENFFDDGNSFRVYRYKGDGPRLSRFVMGRQGGTVGIADTGEYLSLRIKDFKAGDKYNSGVVFKSQAEADAAMKYLADQAAKEYDGGTADMEPDVVEIVRDSGRLRAVADDGEHGRNFVSMPKWMRDKEGTKYRALDLKWNGKNYSAHKFTTMDGKEVVQNAS